ncbi:MAG: SHOCT domain-containing protein [Chitinispirillaceae bacterium]
MDWGHMNWGWGGGFMILLWIVIIALVIFLLVRYLRGYAPGGGQESALDVLRKRYARGEISKEEFEEKKKDLM